MWRKRSILIWLAALAFCFVAIGPAMADDEPDDRYDDDECCLERDGYLWLWGLLHGQQLWFNLSIADRADAPLSTFPPYLPHWNHGGWGSIALAGNSGPIRKVVVRYPQGWLATSE